MSQQINLFNPIFLKQAKLLSLLTIVQALGLILLGSCFFYGYAWYQVHQLTQQSIESEKRLKMGEANLVRYTAEFSPKQANETLRMEVLNLEKQHLDQTKVVDALKSGAVGNTDGYSAYMRAFSRQINAGLWLTGFSVLGNGAQISLNGGVLRAELLPAYIRRLNSEAIMQGKSFSKLQMQQPIASNPKDVKLTKYVEFSLQSEADGKQKVTGK